MKFTYCLLTLLSFSILLASPLEAKTKHQSKHHATQPKSSPIPNIIGNAELNKTLNDLINNSGDPNADITVYVKSMKQGDTLFAREVDKPMTPASTMKIFTAETALLFLGSDYRFSTQLLADSKIVKNGILQGNLYVVLSGDPSLTYNDLYELMLALRSQQIQAITGNVYIDHSAFDQQIYGQGWSEKDKGYCFAAPISASIINHNCVSFEVAPAKVAGRMAQVVTSPKYFLPPIHNSVLTKPNRSRSCGLRLNKEGGELTIDGCLSKGTYARGITYVVTDIPEYNKALFKSLLKQLQINVYGNVVMGHAPTNTNMISQHASKPLHELVNDMLKKSDNIIASALFKKIGQLYSHQPGSWNNASSAVSQLLSKHAGLNASGLKMIDGSGLSPDNLASAAHMMRVLEFAYHHDGTSYEFISALPIAGVDGTLKHRMYNLARKVRAKTGTISGVVSLAGYTITAEKEPLAFVIMINGSKGMGWKYKALEDKIATALTKYSR